MLIHVIISRDCDIWAGEMLKSMALLPDIIVELKVVTDYYECYGDPDLILNYNEGDIFYKIPACPIINMGKECANVLFDLPTTTRDRFISMKSQACKVVCSSEVDIAEDGELFDIVIVDDDKTDTIVNALALGCIPVTMLNPRTVDWIANGITGILCDSEDAILSHVEELIHDPVLRMNMSESGQQWVRKNADINILRDMISRIKR